jgi:hypothetical protein
MLGFRMLSLESANRLMGVAWIPFALGAAALWVSPVPVPEWRPSESESKRVPKGGFEQLDSAYAAIADGPIHIEFNPPSEQIPDLRPILQFFGKDSRPDSADEEQTLHLSVRGVGRSRETASILPGQKMYLKYDGNYSLSPQPTSLWIEATVEGDDARVTVFLRGTQEDLVSRPEAHRSFLIKGTKAPRTGLRKWELNGVRVDGSFLARQRVRWYGQDVFLEEHGGDEYADAVERQRLQIGTGDDLYIRYTSPSEALIWKDGQWQSAELGPETRDYPLLHMNQADDKLLRFELWDAEGGIHVPMNVVRSMDIWKFPGRHKVRFVGARTRSQWILDLDGDRMVVGPDEWLLYTDEKWMKLDTISKIDAYVDGALSGELMICEGLAKRDDGQQVFVTRVYNATRSAIKAVELSTQAEGVKVFKPEESSDEDEDEEESSDELELGLRVEDARPAPEKRLGNRVKRMMQGMMGAG